MRPTLVVRGLTQTFGGNPPFTLSIPWLELFPGELTYIGGPSGSGKSTLIKLLALETRPPAGDLWTLDRHINSLPDHQRDDLRGGGITYIPQGDLGLVDQPPVEIIRRLLFDYEGVDFAEGTRRAEYGLARAKLPPERFYTRVKLLSGGEKARVAIGKAYAAERPICLADEILPALDEETRMDIVDLFQELAEDGFTVVIVAHQPNLRNRFHRVVELDRGQIRSDQRYAPVVRGRPQATP
ncbi:MAG TPA: ATP-binding cassette domain-containing protein [Ktedonobacterales bacterium]|nr:ATP-binding cassette domain-containing protein [Ktedonobacterales bacterium]